MARAPAITGTDAIRALRRAGFEVARIAGSHHMLVHSVDSSRRVVVPVHKGKDLKRGTVRAIVRAAGLTPEEFQELL